MAKQSYKIPYSLDQSYADMTIALKSRDGSVGRVIPFVTIMAYVISALACLFLVARTFIGSMGTIPQIILFVAIWACLTVLLFKYDGTRRMNVQRIMTLLKYIPSKARHVYTRDSRSAIPFMNIAGIDKIEDDGLIHYIDGTFGYAYRVVGNASILLFESDQRAILNRVNNYFKKWQTDSETIFITSKESQKIYRQLANLQRRYDSLQNDDSDLRDLAEEQFRILRDYVGHEFKSIHQYMIIKADNKEAMRASNIILKNEVENSSLFIKQCVPLEYKDTVDMLSSIYQKGDS